MARITTTGSIRTTVTTATFAIAATLALAACGSSSDTSLAPAAKSAAPSSSQTPSSSQASDAAPKANPKAKVEKVAVQRPAAQSTTSPRSARTGTKKKIADLEYVKIVEPFGTPGRCDPAGTTIEMTACFLKKVVDVDYTVDVLQAQRFEYGTSANEGAAELRDDAKWLAKRTKTCSAQPSGGSIDQITQARCLLKVSKARVRSLS